MSVPAVHRLTLTLILSRPESLVVEVLRKGKGLFIDCFVEALSVSAVPRPTEIRPRCWDPPIRCWGRFGADGDQTPEIRG